jgi:hypothetical protein
MSRRWGEIDVALDTFSPDGLRAWGPVDKHRETVMTERVALKYSMDAYWRAIHSGMDTSAAARVAIARFKTYYPPARERDVREKLAHELAEGRIDDRAALRDPRTWTSRHFG